MTTCQIYIKFMDETLGKKTLANQIAAKMELYHFKPKWWQRLKIYDV